MNKLAITVLTLLFLQGCASSLSGDTYSREQTRRLQSIQLGVVESVREVQIEGTSSNIGTATGAAIGGLLGHASSSNQTVRNVGGIAGAVIGGMAGAAAEEGLTRQKGYEIVVRMDNGELFATVQTGEESLLAGDRVYLIKDGSGTLRVTRQSEAD